MDVGMKRNDPDAKLAGTARIALAMQREPSLLLNVMHELIKSEEVYPDLLLPEAIRTNESVLSVRGVQPKVLDYHIHVFMTIKAVLDEIKDVMPWTSMPYVSTMLSLFRGFFPKIYSPNPLYAFLVTLTERALANNVQTMRITGDTIERSISLLQDMREAVESIWRVKLPKIVFKFGPIAAPDLLVSASGYDDMVVFNPTAPLSHCWPGISVAAISRLLLHKHYPKLDERVKDQLSLLSVRAIIGEPVLLPGACHDVLSQYTVDDAQRIVERIAKDLASSGDFDRRALHFFPSRNAEENYSIDMIGSIITLSIDDRVDERELFARVSASNVGYRPFDLDFLVFQKSLDALQQASIIKRDEENNMVSMTGWRDPPRAAELT